MTYQQPYRPPHQPVQQEPNVRDGTARGMLFWLILICALNLVLTLYVAWVVYQVTAAMAEVANTFNSVGPGLGS